MYLNTKLRIIDEWMRINCNINAVVKNIELSNYEMSEHTLSVCPWDQHSFWFTGGIFEEIFSSWGNTSSPGFTGFFSLQAWISDAQGWLTAELWFLGFLVSRVVVQEGFPSLVSKFWCPSPKTEINLKTPNLE